MEKQTTRWSKGELELMKNTFSGEKGEDLLLKVRDVLLQFSNEVPKLNEDVIAIISKMLLPDLDKSLPLGLQADITNALSGSQDTIGIKDVHPEIAILHIEANDLVKSYLKQVLGVLRGEKTDYPICLKDLKSPINKTNDERLISMLAYLFLENSYIDAGLMSIRDHANFKEETPEEKAKKEKANSTK